MEEHAQAHQYAPELRLYMQDPSWSRHLVLVYCLMSLLHGLRSHVLDSIGIAVLLQLVVQELGLCALYGMSQRRGA